MSAVKIVFEQAGDFLAMYAAEDWCRLNGVSYGSAERGSPRGLLRGDFNISKWRNLSLQDRADLHGRMTGDMRNGPVMIEMQATGEQA